MPQLVPFFFINQVTFAFIVILILIYTLSKNILPNNVKTFIARTFVSKI